MTCSAEDGDGDGDIIYTLTKPNNNGEKTMTNVEKKKETMMTGGI